MELFDTSRYGLVSNDPIRVDPSCTSQRESDHLSNQFSESRAVYLADVYQVKRSLPETADCIVDLNCLYLKPITWPWAVSRLPVDGQSYCSRCIVYLLAFDLALGQTQLALKVSLLP